MFKISIFFLDVSVLKKCMEDGIKRYVYFGGKVFEMLAYVGSQKVYAKCVFLKTCTWISVV